MRAAVVAAGCALGLVSVAAWWLWSNVTALAEALLMFAVVTR